MLQKIYVFNSIQDYLYSAFYNSIFAKQLYRKLSFYNSTGISYILKYVSNTKQVFQFVIIFHNITILTILFDRNKRSLGEHIRGFFEKGCYHFAGHLEQKLISHIAKTQNRQ